MPFAKRSASARARQALRRAALARAGSAAPASPDAPPRGSATRRAARGVRSARAESTARGSASGFGTRSRPTPRSRRRGASPRDRDSERRPVGRERGRRAPAASAAPRPFSTTTSGRSGGMPKIQRSSGAAAHAAEHGLVGRAQRGAPYSIAPRSACEVGGPPSPSRVRSDRARRARAARRRRSAASKRSGLRAAQRERARLGLARGERDDAEQLDRGARRERQLAAPARDRVEHVADGSRKREPGAERGRRSASERPRPRSARDRSRSSRAPGPDEQRARDGAARRLGAARPAAREQHAAASTLVCTKSFEKAGWPACAAGWWSTRPA